MKALFTFFFAIAWSLLPATADNDHYPETEVAPYRLSAIDFNRHLPLRKPGKEALEGTMLEATMRLILLDLPFPRTALPLHVYARVRASNPRDSLVLETIDHGKRLPLATATDLTPGQWQWVALPPVEGTRIKERVRLDAAPFKEAGQAIALDSLVISTQADLSAKQLDHAPLWMSGGPMAQVSKTATPPRIDAKGDDPVWEKAVAIRDFILLNVHTPARLSTTARFLYDDKALYLQLVADEPLLQAALMRMEEIKTLATERDAHEPYDVLNDDAAMLLLQPKENAAVYEWSVNTIGALLDAKLDPDNLWQSRDVRWNADEVRSSVARHEGHWIWELAIPFEALDLSVPAPGESWNIALARNAVGSKEASTWNRTGRGAHLPQEWGELRFAAGSGDPIQPATAFGALEPGLNHWKVQLANPQEDRYLTATRIRPENAPTELAQTLSPAQPGKPATLEHHYPLETAARSEARWAIYNAATMEELYRSPQSRIDIRSSSLTLHLTTPGAYDVILNDTIVNHGTSAQDASIRLTLRQGANHLAIRAEAGKATARLSGEGSGHLPLLWRVKATEEASATRSDLDDRDWPLAKEAKASKEAGPVILRRLILSNHTQIWPVPDPALAIARNSVQAATFKFNGLPKRTLGKWITWVAIPQGLEVRGVTGYYGNYRKDQPIFTIERHGSVTLEGKETPLYKVSADKPLFHSDTHPPGGRTGIFHLMLALDEKETGHDHFQLHYWSEAEAGGVGELAQSFSVQSAPALNGKQPKEFVFELWASTFGSLDSKPVRKEILDTIQKAGFNLIVDNRKHTLEEAAQHGVKTGLPVSFISWSIDLTSHLKENPEEALLRFNGERSPDWLCTTLLLDQSWPVAREALEKLLTPLQPDTVCYDYEYSPWRSVHACFCPRCLKAFREAHPEAAARDQLDAKTIEADYRSQWEAFMAKRAARLVAKMRTAVHEILPGKVFSVFSLPQSARTISVYGIDWRDVVREKGTDVIQIGTSGAWRDIVATSKVAGETPIMYGVWIIPYGPSHMIPAHVATKAELLRRVLDSTHGILFYDRNTMDGYSWYNVGETTRLVADFEPIFLRSRPEAVPGHDEEVAQWMRGEKHDLLCLMNHGSEPQTFTLPEGLPQGYEYYSHRPLLPGKAQQITIAPHETAVYVFAK